MAPKPQRAKYVESPGPITFALIGFAAGVFVCLIMFAVADRGMIAEVVARANCIASGS